MWISVISPNDNFNTLPQFYIEEVFLHPSSILPDECYNAPLLYRFFDDDYFDEDCLISQGFQKRGENLFRRDLSCEDFRFVLNNMLEFNWI